MPAVKRSSSRKAVSRRETSPAPASTPEQKREDPLPVAAASGGSLLAKLVVVVVAVAAAAAAAAFHFDYVPVNASEQQLDLTALRSLAYASKLHGSDPQNPLQGANTIVTGATSGLGQATATELYGLGATVVLASRNADKCKKVQATIQQAYPTSVGTLDCGLTVDLADLSTVTAFAKSFERKYKHANLLVNNAGMHYVSAPIEDAIHRLDVPQVSAQGYDYSFSSNYLGHYLLTKLLLPGMLAADTNTGKHARIINVASSYHLQSDGSMLRPSGAGDVAIPEAASSDINTFTFRNRAYANSKFAQVLHAKELQKRLHQQGNSSVRVHSVCPAWVNTGILPNNAGGAFVSRHAFTPKAASVITIGAALRNDFKGGEFVAIFRNWFTTQPWSHAMFTKLTLWGVRDAACNALSMFILASQGKSYGIHVQPSSPEADDAELARSLFDWSDSAVTKFVESEAAAAAATAAANAKALADKKAAEASVKAEADKQAEAARVKKDVEIHAQQEIAQKKAEEDRVEQAKAEAQQQAAAAKAKADQEKAANDAARVKKEIADKQAAANAEARAQAKAAEEAQQLAKQRMSAERAKQGADQAAKREAEAQKKEQQRAADMKAKAAVDEAAKKAEDKAVEDVMAKIKANEAAKVKAKADADAAAAAAALMDPMDHMDEMDMQGMP